MHYNPNKKTFCNIIIFYFSGTGNAKFISEEIINNAKEAGLNSVAIDISNKNVELPQIKDDTLLGFCSPTHGFNMPPIMLKFIRKFKTTKAKNVKAFILNTRAGMKFYKFFTPGLSGVALILPAILLRFKKYKIVGYRPMDMPSNWISLHPGIREKVVISIVKRCKRISKSFTKKIISGKKVYRGLLSLPIDLAIIPISIVYYLIGRFGLAKTFVVTDQCNNCSLCIKNCPVNAISEIKGINYWAFTCESCMKCMNTCPKRAIETSHTYTFLIWWLIFSGLGNLIKHYLFDLDIFQSLNDFFKNQVVYNTILIGLSFLVIWLSYKLLHWLMHFKFFNRIIAYSSLSHYKFWRRYKFPRNIIRNKISNK